MFRSSEYLYKAVQVYIIASPFTTTPIYYQVRVAPVLDLYAASLLSYMHLAIRRKLHVRADPHLR